MRQIKFRAKTKRSPLLGKNGYSEPKEVFGFGVCNGVVSFYNGCFIVKQCGFDYSKKYNELMSLYEWLEDHDCEVIGNIFENPELLK